MVVGSREKAKELHSALALQPSRKVQREAGIDMQRVVRDLRARGIGANNAADPSGLDAVAAAAIEQSNAGLECPSGQHVSSAAAVDEKHRKEHSSVSDPKSAEEAITSDGSKCPRGGSSTCNRLRSSLRHLCAATATKPATITTMQMPSVKQHAVGLRMKAYRVYSLTACARRAHSGGIFQDVVGAEPAEQEVFGICAWQPSNHQHAATYRGQDTCPRLLVRIVFTGGVFQEVVGTVMAPDEL